MKIRGSSYFLLLIILVTLFVIGWSLLAMEYFEAKLLPLLIGSTVLVLASIQFLKEIFSKDKTPTQVAGDEVSGRQQAREDVNQHLREGAWVGGFVLGTYLLGFIVIMPLFILIYTKRLGGRWRTAIISATIFSALIYALFELALNVKLYRGLIAW